MFTSYSNQPHTGGLVRGYAGGEGTNDEGIVPVGMFSDQQTQPASSEKDPNKRQKYLKILGFRPDIDPFLNPVAEQEIDRAGNIAQFFAYYYSPETTKAGALNVERLRASQHSFIFGQLGDGKTTLRLILDASCRTRPDKSLVVTYLLDLANPIDAERHGKRLAQAIAVDFVLQWIEQVAGQLQEDRQWNDREQLMALARQVDCAGVPFRRFLQTILDEPTEVVSGAARSRLGLAAYWKQAARYPVQYVAASEALKRLLSQALSLLKEQKFEKLPGMQGVWQGLRDAQTWGFRQALVLVDGVDAQAHDPDKMTALLTPLLAQLPESARQSMYFKFFIPLEIKSRVDAWCQNNLPSDLYSTCLNATIIWTQSSLRQLLIQRFRAAGSQMISSLDELADPGLPEGLERPVITMANGSPRKLLEIISKLIQVHAERDSDQIQINQVDLDKIKKAV